MKRAYSLLTVKSVEDEQRIIRGVATTPTPDRAGDIVEPLGVQFQNPLPLLWQHNHSKPVGTVEFSPPTKSGIAFEARLPEISDAGPLKDRVDEAWQSVKAGLVRGVSIGFRALEHSYMDGGGLRFSKSEVIELSLVTVPANAEATIQTIKSIDASLLAASGQSQSGNDGAPHPGAAGNTTKHMNMRPKEGTMTIAEQIAALEASRQAKTARMTAVMQKSVDEGRSTDDAEQDEFDTLEAEVKAIDGDLKRFRALERTNIATATPVSGGDTASGSASRGPVAIQVKAQELPKGTAFTRYALALARAKGNIIQAAEIAKSWSDSTPQVEAVLKAAAAAGTTTDTAWAKPLVEYQNMASEFIEFLRPQTILGRIPNIRHVPFNIKVPRQTGGASATWVGEGAPKPVSSLAFDNISLGFAKIAGIVVMTDELVRFSNPSAEALVRQDLADTIVQLMDRDFVDPAKAAAAGISPASITNGVTPIVASGTDADAVRADVKLAFNRFLTANMSVAGAVWIMKETTALGLALMLNALGQPEFPGLSINGGSGGTFMGLPVILSENIPANPGAGDPLAGAGDRIILAKASEILLADDGQVMIDASREASLQMDTAPTAPTASTVMVSLWQANMVGIRAERYINWAKRRPGAVQYIDSVNYGG